MKYQVIVLPAAKEDLYGILAWIKERSPQGAAAWFRAWNNALHALALDPAGVPAPENADHEIEIRQLLFKTRKGRVYRTLFTVRGEQVVVLRVRGPGQDRLTPEEIEEPPEAE